MSITCTVNLLGGPYVVLCQSNVPFPRWSIYILFDVNQMYLFLSGLYIVSCQSNVPLIS